MRAPLMAIGWPRLQPLPSTFTTESSIPRVRVVATHMEANASLRGRTHMGQILGIGHQRSQGLKAGVINDLELAEETIRQTVHAAERMAKVQVKSSIVNISGGRLSSEALEGRADTRGRPVSEASVREREE